jgi:chromate transport protein ChrA
MRGISPAVIATLAVTIVQLVPHAVGDAFTGGVLLATVIVMLAWQKLPVLPSIACGGLAGILRGAFR